ncbi:hypothetical protein MRB53_032800 [Persea americana]|uniref:Uncharacterized protein n=1 Tax=Persea americana TaxID=3435 RepID=A0ACC2KSX1_PERAE|nr:hypothetical protein MRB53_032800 [Persea americana]
MTFGCFTNENKHCLKEVIVPNFSRAYSLTCFLVKGLKPRKLILIVTNLPFNVHQMQLVTINEIIDMFKPAGFLNNGLLMYSWKVFGTYQHLSGICMHDISSNLVIASSSGGVEDEAKRWVCILGRDTKEARKTML